METSQQRIEDAHSLIYEFMKTNNISDEDYDFELFVNHIIDKYDISLKKVHFGPTMAEIISGIILFAQEKWFIHINDSMIPTRQRFTICHELSHFIWDCDYGTNKTALESVMQTEYSNSDRVEFLANNSAGVFMLPDICIKRSINDGLTFNNIMNKYKVSHAALRYRLIQFLILNLNCPAYLAIGPVDDFINKNDASNIKFYFSDIFTLSTKIEDKFMQY